MRHSAHANWVNFYGLDWVFELPRRCVLLFQSGLRFECKKFLVKIVEYKIWTSLRQGSIQVHSSHTTNMGNTASDVTNNVKAQADAAESATYKLVNMKGGGELISLMETAKLTKDYTSVNEQIKQKVSGLLYNEGKGEYVTAPNRNKLLLKEPLWIDSSFWL